MSSDTTFTINLKPTGDEGSALRYRNETPNQVQRPTLIDRSDAFGGAVEGNLQTIIHGQFGGESLEDRDKAATLIVAHFWFFPPPQKRFHSVSIDFIFKDPQPGVYAPEVIGIAPGGTVDLFRSTGDCSSNTKKCARIGFNILGFKAMGSVEKETSLSHEGVTKGVLNGGPYANRDSGPRNGVRWFMSENKAKRTGIPSELRVAILLKRQDDQPFVAQLKVDAKIDTAYAADSALRRLFGLYHIDDVNFSPAEVGMGRGTPPLGSNTDQLSKVMLSSLCQIGPVDSEE